MCMKWICPTNGCQPFRKRNLDNLVPMRLFKSRAFSSGIAASLLFYAAMYGVLFLLPQFLQTALGYGPFGAGLL